VGTELKAVAQDVLHLGARYVQAGRAWLTDRRNEMANRNEEHGGEQQSSMYGGTGSGREYQQSRGQGQSRYQSQNQSSQNQQRYQGQGQSEYQPQYQQGGQSYQSGQQRYGGGSREYGSDDSDFQGYDTQGYRSQGYGGQSYSQGRGMGEQYNEFGERAQSWDLERGSDYSPGYSSQNYGQNRQQASGQRGQQGSQQHRSDLGGSYLLPLRIIRLRRFCGSRRAHPGRRLRIEFRLRRRHVG
jgi:hypothetical protein